MLYSYSKYLYDQKQIIDSYVTFKNSYNSEYKDVIAQYLLNRQHPIYEDTVVSTTLSFHGGEILFIKRPIGVERKTALEASLLS